MTKQHDSGGVVPGRRRVFTADYKREAVRQYEARRAQGVSHAQIARDLEISVTMLRAWAHQLARAPRASDPDVFPGQGRLSTDAEELRRLQREVHRLQQENSFLKSAAAYFAKESR